MPVARRHTARRYEKEGRPPSRRFAASGSRARSTSTASACSSRTCTRARRQAEPCTRCSDTASRTYSPRSSSRDSRSRSASTPPSSGRTTPGARTLTDKLELAIEPAYFRRKREGYGDRRYNLDGRIQLSGDRIETLTEAGFHQLGVELESDGVDEALDDLSLELSWDAEWTLRQLARPLAEGARIREVTTSAGLTIPRAKRRLEELREELTVAESGEIPGRHLGRHGTSISGGNGTPDSGIQAKSA
jgi:hypothetical protein